MLVNIDRYKYQTVSSAKVHIKQYSLSVYYFIIFVVIE